MIGLAVDLVLAVFGLFFLYTGVVSFLRPEPFARALSLEAVGRSGAVEIRAQYGGFFFAAALSQFAALCDLMAPFGALMVALVIFGGLILGRLGSFVFGTGGQALTPTIRALFLIDGGGAVVAAACLLLATPVAGI